MASDKSEFVVRSKPPIAQYERPNNPQFTPDGWIWIRDAIRLTGRHLFADVWTDTEMTARDLPPLKSEVLGHDADDTIDAEQLINGGSCIRRVASEDGLRRAITSNRPRMRPMFKSARPGPDTIASSIGYVSNFGMGPSSHISSRRA